MAGLIQLPRLAANLLLLGSLLPQSTAWIKLAASNQSVINRQTCSQTGVSCTILEDTGCTMAGNWPPSPGSSPGPPSHLVIETYLLTGEFLKSWSGANISWQLPANVPYEYLTGFQLLIQSYENPTQITCFIFNMTSTQWKPENAGLKFFLDDLAFSGEKETRGYNIQISSLPLSAVHDIHQSAILTVPWKAWDRGEKYTYGPENAATWNPDIVVQNDSCTRTVTVTFNQAPTTFNFEAYNIEIDKGDQVLANGIEHFKTDDGSDHGVVIFSDVPEGSPYKIKIIVENTGYQTPSCRCTCHNVEGCYGVCADSGCITTASVTFDFRSVVQSECVFEEASPPNGDMQPAGLTVAQWVGIALGIALGLTAALVAVLVLKRKRLQKEAAPSDPLKVIQLQVKKTVFVWYSDDDNLHSAVVWNLARLLRNRANCDIISDPEISGETVTDRADWVLQKMRAADKIVIVMSQGVVSKIAALRSQSRGFSKREEDGFLLGYRAWLQLETQQKRKLISVYFGYFSSSGNPFVGDVTWHLMQDAYNLILSIHNERAPPGSCNEAGQQSCEQYEEARALTAAILEAKAHGDSQHRTQIDLSLPPPNTDVGNYTMDPTRERKWMGPETQSVSDFDASEADHRIHRINEHFLERNPGYTTERTSVI